MNKYLNRLEEASSLGGFFEKTALNKYETYLANKPAGWKHPDPKVQKAYLNLQVAQRKERMAWKAMEVPGWENIAMNYDREAGEAIKANRPYGPTIVNGKRKGPPGKGPGKAPGKSPMSTLAGKEEAISNKFLNVIRRNPVKTGLIGAGITGAIGYGIHRLTKDD